MKSCFGYIRVSTPKQGEGVSLEVQQADISEQAGKRGLMISEWFVELETAAKTGRPIFNKMVGRLKRGHAAALMVHKLDRSSRNMVDWGVVSKLMDSGIEFYIATDPMDFSTRAGRFTADMLAVLAADFSRNQREETIKGLRGRLKQGLFPYRPPLGYLKGGKGKPKPPCPINAPLVRQLFELYGSGQHSLESARTEIHKRGLRNHLGGAISLHGVEKALSNPFYHGQIFIKRTGEVFEGVHEPIISKALFQKVQKIKSRRCGPKVTRHTHNFLGVFRCSSCAGPLVPERQKAHVYYRCHKSKCDMTAIREDRLDSAIRARLAALQLTPDSVSAMEIDWDKNGLIHKTEAERRSILARIEDCQSKLTRLADLLLDDAIDRSTYKTKHAELTFDMGHLRRALDQLPDIVTIKRDRANYVAQMSDLTLLYEKADPAERRQMLSQLFEKRTADTKAVFLASFEMTEPFFVEKFVAESEKSAI